MSHALEQLLAQYFRVQSGPKYRVGDIGNPPTSETITQVIASLSDCQRRLLDEKIIAQLLNALNEESKHKDRYHDLPPAEKSNLIKQILELDPPSRGAVLVNWAVVIGIYNRRNLTFIHTDLTFKAMWWVREAFRTVSKRKHSLNLDQVRAIVDSDRSHASESAFGFCLETLDPALEAIAKNRDQWTFSDQDRSNFRDIIEALAQYSGKVKNRAHIALLRELVEGEKQIELWLQEPWAKAIADTLASMSPQSRQSWTKALSFAATCSTSKPAKLWRTQAGQLLAAIDEQEFQSHLSKWLRNFIAEPRAQKSPSPEYVEEKLRVHRQDLAGYHANTSLVIGLVWLTQARWHPAFGPLLADIAEAIARWPQSVRELCVHIGGAAVKALATRDEDDVLALLSRLAMRIRWPKLKTLVRKQFDETLARRGLDRAHVEESLVPDFGLVDGVAQVSLGDCAARITLAKADKPALEWFAADAQKSSRAVPAAIRKSNATAVDQIRQTVSDIEKMRAAQRTRLDLLMRRSRQWPFDLWRQRYLDHGLVGTLARRLIWIVNEIPVIWLNGALMDAHGQTQTFSNKLPVSLWHPAQRTIDEVVTWRRALEQWQIAQPFKQAHREVYLLTDAERRTDVYSNRFAAHIVRAMTLLSISQVRQWKSGLFGGASSPSFDMPDLGLRAEWWMEQAGDEYTPFGTPVYLASDQVRFLCTTDSAARQFGHTPLLTQPLALDRVPPLVFSEIMRDVDLFVALASVGNDPTWSDGGPEGRYRTYWQSFSFGDLTETAKTRKAVLEILLPRLKIAKQCSLTDKFLRVQGAIRTYKIHLGSGNILMEPNDQYLCIVPAQSAKSPAMGGGDLYLPFEGDQTLAVILSKAFLLANDKKITDPTILHQIKS